ncbi:MAG: DUF429 domain-containing protein [Elusimicrobia bacterium]|nr:DUF429 domain-containing protein [Elusimicrobiota bacterium]
MFAGIDACRGGWIVVLAKGACPLVLTGTDVCETFSEAAKFAASASTIAVDIPIGLMDRDFREVDERARKLMGRRFMCVFRAPPRPVLSAKSYEEAKRRYRDLCGQGMTKQAFGIMPKIAEVDKYLRTNPCQREKIFEVHPELCFRALNGGQPVLSKKKTEEGIQDRYQLLKRTIQNPQTCAKKVLDEHLRREVKEDDVIDALAACVTAAIWVSEGNIPWVNPPRDSIGLPMQMRNPPTTIS